MSPGIHFERLAKTVEDGIWIGAIDAPTGLGRLAVVAEQGAELAHIDGDPQYFRGMAALYNVALGGEPIEISAPAVPES